MMRKLAWRLQRCAVFLILAVMIVSCAKRQNDLNGVLRLIPPYELGAYDKLAYLSLPAQLPEIPSTSTVYERSEKWLTEEMCKQFQTNVGMQGLAEVTSGYYSLETEEAFLICELASDILHYQKTEPVEMPFPEALTPEKTTQLAIEFFKNSGLPAPSFEYETECIADPDLEEKSGREVIFYQLLPNGRRIMASIPALSITVRGDGQVSEMHMAWQTYKQVKDVQIIVPSKVAARAKSRSAISGCFLDGIEPDQSLKADEMEVVYVSSWTTGQRCYLLPYYRVSVTNEEEQKAFIYVIGLQDDAFLFDFTT